MIKELILKSIELTKLYLEVDQVTLSFPDVIDKGIPTLKPGTYQDCSLMLKERYEMFGRWESATHGHWLSLSDMEAMWEETIEDNFLGCIQAQRVAGELGWPDEASALFRPERLSLFACSDITNEKIYLLWFEFEDEPELWVYDSNGESRYKNLEEYLIAYLNDDLSASEKTWKA